MSRLEIRRAGPEDVETMGWMHVACWQAAYRDILPAELLGGLSPQKASSRFMRGLKTGREEFYLPCVDGLPAGRLVLGQSRDKDAAPATGEIAAFYLLPAHWGQGYGRTMMHFALDRLAGLGYTQATLWVLAENSRARRFYEAAGFLPDGTEKLALIGGWQGPELRYRWHSAPAC